MSSYHINVNRGDEVAADLLKQGISACVCTKRSIKLGTIVPGVPFRPLGYLVSLDGLLSTMATGG